jgi:hypothetical protein
MTKGEGTMNTVKTVKVLNIVAVKDNMQDAVNLQITDDMKVEDIMNSIATWLEWGYSIKAAN